METKNKNKLGLTNDFEKEKRKRHLFLIYKCMYTNK